MDMADADRAADLRIDRAQIAMLVVRQRFVLRLLGHRMRDAMRNRTLLGEQQGDDEQRFQKDGAQHGAHSNRRPFAFQVRVANGVPGYMVKLHQVAKDNSHVPGYRPFGICAYGISGGTILRE